MLAYVPYVTAYVRYVLMTSAQFSTRTGRWALTLAATAAATLAADAMASAAGVVLVASHVLHGLPHDLLFVVLAGTYLLWGAGLKANLAANWALLEDTGTSTNALSKVAYDVAKLRTRCVRARRLASVTGYVGTELAKEVPYYAGAFGAALCFVRLLLRRSGFPVAFVENLFERLIIFRLEGQRNTT